MAIRCDIVSIPRESGSKFDRRVGIVIPAYNEVEHIADVIAACRAVEPAIVLVVDDCSSDATPVVLEREIRRDDSNVPLRALRCGHNLGKQGAVRKGLRVLRDYELDAVALIDGDGQHDPRELPRLAGLLDEFDFVLGARAKDQMPVQRQLANWLVNLGFRLIGGVDFVDVQSGLRIYRKQLADVLAERLPQEGGFALEHESLTLLARWSEENERDLLAAAAPIFCDYETATSSIRPLHVLQLGYETVRQALRLRRAARAPSMTGGCHAAGVSDS